MLVRGPCAAFTPDARLTPTGPGRDTAFARPPHRLWTLQPAHARQAASAGRRFPAASALRMQLEGGGKEAVTGCSRQRWDTASGAFWARYLALMAVSGAALGPCLDGYHSAFGVLRYTVPQQVYLGGVFVCETDYWVPPMFALAAVILAVAYPVLDEALGVADDRRQTSAPAVLQCIGYFTLQYYASGLLTAQGIGGTPLHSALAVTAALCWFAWDRTATGTIMAVATGVCVCVCVCVRARARACVLLHACMHACMCT